MGHPYRAAGDFERSRRCAARMAGAGPALILRRAAARTVAGADTACGGFAPLGCGQTAPRLSATRGGAAHLAPLGSCHAAVIILC